MLQGADSAIEIIWGIGVRPLPEVRVARRISGASASAGRFCMQEGLIGLGAAAIAL